MGRNFMGASALLGFSISCNKTAPHPTSEASVLIMNRSLVFSYLGYCNFTACLMASFIVSKAGRRLSIASGVTSKSFLVKLSKGHVVAIGGADVEKSFYRKFSKQGNG